ncbi:MAG: T9SS type A sorting domain-containing protein [Bacteroidia bacterium]|nr:T9SS type A sorting domain-containing protein [Bacteroidia bacterium]
MKPIIFIPSFAILRIRACFLLFYFSTFQLFSQYAPPAGQPGSTAIYKDSSIIKGWAIGCTIQRGLMDISTPGSGFASYGNSEAALGKADNSTISQGDGGIVILKFNPPIMNGPGFDFAVFENGFSDSFLELAFVEVSSDGIHFYRFNSVSLTQDTQQVGGFDTLDATKIHNLAGKYRMFYGVPFDLEELKGNSGLNVDSITYIRIIDVVGSIDPAYASHDSAGRIINDPWPTPFASSGFDLDAVGVIHAAFNSIEKNTADRTVSIYPNPVTDQIIISSDDSKIEKIEVCDPAGKILLSKEILNQSGIIKTAILSPGIYFIRIKTDDGFIVKKINKF